MKKFSIIILAIMLITTLSVGLMACSIGGGNTGKYFLYENGEIDESSYIELKSGGKWTDGEDSGTYEIDGNKITFYIDKEEYLSGTISNGVIELDVWGFGTIVYKKSGAKGDGTTTKPNQPGNGDNSSDNPSDNPSVPDDDDGEFLVTYNLNYGSNPVVQHKTVNKKVDFVPDRTGYVFNGWFLLKDMSQDNEPVLGALWDTSQTVTDSNLVLYADWYAKPKDGALPTPVVELDGNTFRWASISGANGYQVTIYQGTSEVDSFTHYGNSYTFSGYEAGSYQVQIMAKGDGVSTINSGTVTRNILYKYLGKITATLNQETMVVSWSEVQYAEEYVVYLDNTLIKTTSTETSCQIPETDVGTHNIIVRAQLSGWISSSDSVSYKINKLRKPDNIVVSFDEAEMQYTISWASVKGANQYKVYGVGGVRTVNTNSIVIDESDWGNNETKKSIQIYAFDSYADYLQSNASENISLDRIFKVQAVSENGTATLSLANAQFDVTFDLNYLDCPEASVQTITKDNCITYPTPTRDDYIFNGWYLDKKCTTLYDFSSKLYNDITLYAGWEKNYNQAYVLEINQWESTYTKSSGAKFAFTPLVSGTYTLKWYNSSSSAKTVFTLYSDTGLSIEYSSMGAWSNTSERTQTLTLEAGEQYWFYVSASNNATTFFDFGFFGQEIPTCNPNPVSGEGDTEIYAKAGTEVTFTANVYSGYTFVGWYDQTGNTKMSSDLTYTMAISAGNYRPIAKCRKVTLESNNSEAGSVTLRNAQGVDANASTTINFNTQGGSSVSSVVLRNGEAFTYPSIPTKSGYVFAGWYDNASCSGSPYSFSNIASTSVTVYAKWIAYSGAGVLNPNSSQSIYVYSKSSSTTRYYAFVPLVSESITIYTTGSLDTYGYLYNANKSQIASDDDGGDVNNFKITYSVTAGQLYYIRPCGYSSNGYATVVVNANMPQYTISSTLGRDFFIVGETAKLTATTNNGYTFIGWFDGDTKVSDQLVYDLVMPAEDKTYTAKWCQITLDTNDTSAGTVGGLISKYKVGDSATITATTNNGYTWLGWYDGDTKLTEELSYTFTMPAEDKTYTAKWANCNVTLAKNVAAAGSVSGVEGATAVGKPTTITATTNIGYTFIGWFDGDTKLTDELSYTFTMTAESKTYTAKWCKISLDRNNTSAGTISSLDSTYRVGGIVTVNATTNNGYTWVGWFDRDVLLSDELSYTFTMPAENKTYTAQWTYYTVTTNTNMSEAGTYTRKSQQKVTVGNQVTLEATTNDGYTWVGWFDGDVKLTDELSYTFTMTAENKTYTAKWSKVTLERNNASAGTISSLTSTYKVGDSTTITATTNNGYTWLGWYDGDTLLTDELSYTFTMSAENKIYTAKWITCPINLVKNIEEAGNMSGVEGTTVAGKPTTITAITNIGYTFIGWYDGETLLTDELSYTFAMPMESKTYMAKWSKVTLERNNASAGTISSLTSTYKVGDSATVTATTNIGYTWLGWYDGDTKLTDELSYTFTMTAESKTYTAKWSKVTLDRNNTSAGTVSSLTSTYKVGDSVTITATTNNGYTWVGWFDGDVKLTDELSYTFTMTAENKTYTAKWCKVTLERNNTSAGTIGGLTTAYKVGDIVTITAASNVGYECLGWFDGATLLTDESSYTFAMPAENKTYTAKWQVSEEMSNFIFTSTSTTCSISSIKDKTVTQIVVPEYVTSIGSSTFSGCTSLTSLIIGNGVTNISSGLLSGCGKLESLTIPFVGAVAGKTSSSTYQYPFGYIFGTSSYTGGVATEQHYYGSSTSSTTSTSYYIPSSLKSVTVTGGNILYGAFYGCSSLANITIPNTVTSIGSSAFTGCISLTSITIPSSVTSIDDGAFTGCHSLIEVYNKSSLDIVVGASVAMYAKNVYTQEGGSKLSTDANGYVIYTDGEDKLLVKYIGNKTYLILPSSVTEIYEYAFYKYSSLAKITIPSGITSIGYSAFYNCTSLTSITIPNSVTNIGMCAFEGCSSLTSITIPNSVTSIGSSAFYGCSSLTSVTIGNSVQSIGGSAFDRCSNLTSITIPNSVKSIGSCAFYGCSSLKSVTIKENSQLTSIGDHAFHDCSSLTSITIPDGVTIIRYNAFSGCSSLKIITIPDSVTIIADGAFRGCSSLSSITIPDGVTSIGSYAFDGCSSLTSITIPEGVTSISGYAFSDCSSLTSVTFVENSQLTSIGDYAFRDCSSLTSITLLDSVTSIGDYAFYFCTSLTSITIPKGMTSIGSYAFYACYNVTTIWFHDTAARWKSITKGANWGANMGTNYVMTNGGYISIN
ncbi:MAG: leucine-rich repeat protein [Christensenellales bacterium]